MAQSGNEAIAVDSSEAYLQGDGVEEDTQSSTASLTDSIWEYRKLHGRTFNNFKSGSDYWGPNDELQKEHLDLNHVMLLLAMDNALFFAPLGPKPERVLDVGTGTGIWAIDFANEYPETSVIGTDLSPTQPAWVPPNCKFEIDDASQVPWTYPDNHFDYIHLRLMLGAIEDWGAVYREAYRVLKPGGWIEHSDYEVAVLADDASLGPDSPFHQWGPIFYKAGEKTGRTFETMKQAPGLLKEAGFQDLQEKRLKLPIGSWPADKKLKNVGNYNLAATEAGLEGFALYLLTQVHGWTAEEAHVYIEKMRKELRDRSKHPYYVSVSVFAQKA
ncbi:S-adenosyl-L-methionine-dependent methyltransferase [Podospora aff. communis PSN243]|uniref:S-adenosyl-L-methionine-dependent methyltransferase n=1 Tax=Podospora aff. communis PSN243 TaxID=3040156 RepID=A0AAV9G3A4_9PEZI|nr:S-adenosyl-L-methionine-dependent methyltransferase [Podospora aff. communis PSN243]